MSEEGIKFDTNTIIWLPYPHLQGYLVANIGEIKSSGKYKSNKILSKSISTGYYRVITSHHNVHKSMLVHRMVAETFISNPEDKPCVNHIDGNKLNNQVDNLEWCTYKENSEHAHRTGLCICNYGENSHFSKITEAQVQEIRAEYKKYKTPAVELARKYPINKSEIDYIINNKFWVDQNYELPCRQKFSPSDIENIRYKYKQKLSTYVDLALEYNVSSNTIYRIVYNLFYYNPDYIPPSPNEMQCAVDLDKAREIYSYYQKNIISMKNLANLYNVSKHVIENIIKKKGRLYAQI